MAIASDTQRRNGVARNALRSRAGDVLDDFGALKKDMSKLAQAARKAAKVEVRHTGERLQAIGRDLRTQAGDRAANLSEVVRERPGAAVGISLGAGLLLGLILTARR